MPVPLRLSPPDPVLLPVSPPQIPDGLTNHYLKKSGIKDPDVRMCASVLLRATRGVDRLAL